MIAYGPTTEDQKSKFADILFHDLDYSELGR